MLVVLCLGGSMLAVSVSEVLQSQRKANHAAANVVGQILTADIQNQIDNLRDLAANPITWTSFTDITGRDAYLQPSLVARENHARFTPTALFDYQGEHIAGALPAAPGRARAATLARTGASGSVGPAAANCVTASAAGQAAGSNAGDLPVHHQHGGRSDQRN